MRKGFTMIELLAVIAILAIIMSIATPKVLNTINDAGNGAFASSAKKIIDIANLYVMSEDLELPTNGKFISIPIANLDFENSGAYSTTGGVIVVNIGTAPNNEYHYFVYLSNDDFVINGSTKKDLQTNIKEKDVAVPNTAITLPTSGTILVNETLGITGHVENVTVAGGGYVSYSHS